MKRVLSSLAAVLVLTTAVTVTARAQDPYQTQQQQSTTTTDPAATPTTTSSTESMPATASPLPLVGLGGLASIAAGMWLTRRRKG
jgi:hypothetical protein